MIVKIIILYLLKLYNIYLFMWIINEEQIIKSKNENTGNTRRIDEFTLRTFALFRHLNFTMTSLFMTLHRKHEIFLKLPYDRTKRRLVKQKYSRPHKKAYNIST